MHATKIYTLLKACNAFGFSLSFKILQGKLIKPSCPEVQIFQMTERSTKLTTESRENLLPRLSIKKIHIATSPHQCSQSRSSSGFHELFLLLIYAQDRQAGHGQQSSTTLGQAAVGRQGQLGETELARLCGA